MQVLSFDFDRDYQKESEKKEEIEVRQPRWGSQEVELGSNDEIRPLKVYDIAQMDFYSSKVAEMIEASKEEREHEAMMENLQSEVTFNQPKTPLSAFSDAIKFLPQEIRREAWAHFEQAENTKQIETVKDAQNLAKMYQAKAMAKDSKNSDSNTNTDSGCVIN